MRSGTPLVEDGSVGMTTRCHEPRIVKPLTAAEASRRSRVISTRMPSLRSLARLNKAAKVAGLSVHSFCLLALDNLTRETLQLDAARKVVAASRRAASNVSAEAKITASGGRFR